MTIRIDNPSSGDSASMDTSNLVPYLGATSDLNLGTNNLIVDTNILYVDAASDKVGIGTSTPTQTLDVVGNVKIRAPYLYFTDANGTEDNYALYYESGSPGKLNVRDNSAGINRFTISGANVGIGTVSPLSLLHVNGIITASAITCGTLQGLLAGTGGTVFSIGSTGGAGQVLTADGDNTYSWSSLTTASHNAVTIDTGGSDGGLSVDAEQVLSLALATTGVVSAYTPITVTGLRQMFGGAAVVELTTGILYAQSPLITSGLMTLPSTAGTISLTTGILTVNAPLTTSGLTIIPGTARTIGITTATLTFSAPITTSGQISVAGPAATISLSSITTLNTKSFHVYYPANAATYNVWKVPAAVTLKAVHCMVKGGTSVTGALYEADANGINCTTATVAAAIVSGNDTASNLVNATIDSADYINWITTATSGAVTGLTCSFDYTK